MMAVLRTITNPTIANSVFLLFAGELSLGLETSLTDRPWDIAKFSCRCGLFSNDS